jgi:hypothetical protein
MAENSEILIDRLITSSQLAAGMPADYLATQGIMTGGMSGAGSQAYTLGRNPRWSADEDDYIRANLAYQSLDQVAETLGRSPNAVKCHGYRIGATTPRYAEGYISGNQVAQILGVDSHTPPYWMDRGLLESELYPYPDGSPKKRRATWAAFLRFLIRPISWVYFDVAKIKNDHLRRLVELAQAKWGDEWLTTTEAAQLRGCNLDDVHNSIRHGRLWAYRAGSVDRHRTVAWSYWFVRRSEAATFVVNKGSGSGHAYDWSPRADAFIIRCCTEGIAWDDAARMMRWPVKRIVYRAMLLRRQGLVPEEKPRGRVTREPTKTCIVCLKPNGTKGRTCGSEACLREMVNRHYRERYVHVERKPKAPKPPKVKPARPVVMCEICGTRPATPRWTICGDPECRAERIRRYGKAAYQRRKEKG